MALINGVDYPSIGASPVRVGTGGNSPMGRMMDHPDHFQSLLADVIRRERPRVMIETGIESGYSTEHYLAAMDAVGAGHLYSCDPSPSGFYEANPIAHPRFTFARSKSVDVLERWRRDLGPFDLFVHDSDHSFENMTQEFELAWNFVRSGGIIASDDVGFGTMTVNGAFAHNAWEMFCHRHGVNHLRVKINNAEYFRKP